MRFTKKQSIRGLLSIVALSTCLFYWGGVKAQQPDSQTNGEVGDLFPTLEAETLSKEEITFPTDLEGKANIIILVFKQEAQKLVNTWADVILEEYEPLAEISYHEVPMISTFYKPIGWQIDNWMRGGIPTQWHDNTATFYGDRSPYFQKLNMTEQRSCYVFVLDEEGIIQFRSEGPRNPTDEAKFRQIITTLAR
ncbi:MAG: hypothetical protein AAFQ98_10670 [Bacteroidota bacterium]